MAKARVIVRRRKSVRNIRKITRTMQLIATSKFQRAHARVVASRPYADKIGALVEQLARAVGSAGGGPGGLPANESAGGLSHPLLEKRQAKVDLLLVVTSNRGLCGGYNAAVLRAGLAHAEAEKQAGRSVRLDVIGRKGLLYLKFLGWPIETSNTDIGDKPTFAKVQELANRYIDVFTTQPAIQSVHVAYTRFLHAGAQRPTVVQLLPVGDVGAGDAPSSPSPRAEGRGEGTAPKASNTKEISLENYDFSPSPEQLLAELLPATVRVRLMQYIFEAVLSEQVARMTAMKSATENAEDMIGLLTRQYNRARQYQITKEISEIIGGAAGLK